MQEMRRTKVVTVDVRQPGARLWRSLSLLFPLLAVAPAFVSGCAPQSDRLPVSGKITLDGQPLDDGSIRFTSEDGAKLSATGAAIRNGQFSIPQDKGLPPGIYHVEISAPDTTAPPVAYRPAPGEPALPPTPPERIPADYNSNSTKTVEVAPDDDNHFEFDIVSRSPK